MPKQILLQTTIESHPNDWAIERFSLLRDYLSSLSDQSGRPLFEVTARDRQPDQQGNDPILSTLDLSDFSQLWLFAVDVGDGLSAADCEGIQRFRQRGGGILTTRDHQDLGSSLCKLSGACHPLGSAHFFHSQNPEPEVDRQQRDDLQTQVISWPNYHSGSNGDYQLIQPTEPLHELLLRPDGQALQYFPAHPHEGAVGVPLSGDPNARVIATGTSKISGRSFNLAVVFEQAVDSAGYQLGRAVAESTFHHFCDYNWDPNLGCPNFVSEPPGDGIAQEPQALADIHTYMRNLALWLEPGAA
uniref:ThuA-like domain-containing protein n=1 Tax=Cyanothece sp. (strain PCC 7425 / ATCC 29141) TaxID=395961 RepID=B8HM03_CYAP4